MLAQVQTLGACSSIQTQTSSQVAPSEASNSNVQKTSGRKPHQALEFLEGDGSVASRVVHPAGSRFAIQHPGQKSTKRGEAHLSATTAATRTHLIIDATTWSEKCRFPMPRARWSSVASMAPLPSLSTILNHCKHMYMFSVPHRQRRNCTRSSGRCALHSGLRKGRAR